MIPQHIACIEKMMAPRGGIMQILLEWDDSDASRHRPHVQSNKKQDCWFDTVNNHEAGCKATGTHFCI